MGYYKDHVKMWLNRRNTFTGRLYRCVRASQAGTACARQAMQAEASLHGS